MAVRRNCTAQAISRDLAEILGTVRVVRVRQHVLGSREAVGRAPEDVGGKAAARAALSCRLACSADARGRRRQARASVT